MSRVVIQNYVCVVDGFKSEENDGNLGNLNREELGRTISD
jgi:hypothetical protein